MFLFYLFDYSHTQFSFSIIGGISMTNCIEVKKYRQKYQAKLNEPIVQYFFKEEENVKLLETFLADSSPDNQKRLDYAFQEHFRSVKLLSYIDKLIYFYSIDFDKRINKKNKQFILIDHNSTNSESNKINMENLISSKEDLTFLNFEKTQTKLSDHIDNESLIEGLQFLSDKQSQILNLLYIQGYSNKEISSILNESTQTISYNHKAALSKLKNHLEKIIKRGE